MKLIRKLKYRHKIAIVIFLILLPFLVVSLLFVKNMWDQRVNGVLSGNQAQLQSGVDAINEYYRSGLQKLTYINSNRMITTFLNNADFGNLAQNMTVYDNIKEIVDAIVLSSTDIGFTIYVSDPNAYNGRYVEKMERLATRLESDTISELLSGNMPGNGAWMYRAGEGYGDNLGYIVCYQKMEPFSKALAITEMRIRVKKIIDLLPTGFPKGTIMMYQPDEAHRFFFQMDGDSIESAWQIMPGQVEIATGDYHAIRLPLNNATGAVTGYLPRAYTQAMLDKYMAFTIVAVVAALLFLYFIVEVASFFLTRRITRLVDRTNDSIEKTAVPDVGRPELIEDDLGMIEAKFYEMLENIRVNYIKSMEYENEKKMLELEILQSKINPHFLYNTLSTMRWTCKNEKMAQIIDSMVQYYRLLLNKGQNIVTIAHELKLLEEYLKILKYTYSSDFKSVMEVDDDVRDAWIIKHLLQPIVENAILHGINGLDEGGGVIRITGHQQDGVITLAISDNGVGIPEETMLQLMSGEYKNKLGGYGLQSIRKRISVFYGSIYSLDITSKPGQGTTVTLTFPAISPEDYTE